MISRGRKCYGIEHGGGTALHTGLVGRHALSERGDISVFVAPANIVATVARRWDALPTGDAGRHALASAATFLSLRLLPGVAAAERLGFELAAGVL